MYSLLKIKEIRWLLMVTTIFSQPFFFSINAILGKTYTGMDSSSSFYIFVVALDIIALSHYSYHVFLKKLISIREAIMLSSILIVFLCYFFESPHDSSLFNSFVAFPFPTIIASIYIIRNNALSLSIKWIEPIMLIITIAMGISFVYAIFGGILAGGAGYQSMSYYSGLAFSINLYMIYFGNNHKRFNVFKTNIYYYFSIALLFLQAGASAISSGRGGFMVVLASLLILSIIRLKRTQEHKLNIMGPFFFISICATSIYITLQNKAQDALNFLTSGLERVFSFVSNNGIDMTQTSGRDELYKEAFSYFDKSPIFGYGFFSYFDVMNTYPHNIFIELLLQGGIVFCSFSIIIFYFIIRRFLLLVKNNFMYLIIVPLFIYSFINLLFSMSYLNHSVFWFCITIVVCSPIPLSKSSIQNSFSHNVI